MRLVDVGKTRPSELRRLADWRNELAWSEFQKRYEPLLRCCCKQLALDESATDEVRQETWIEVAIRMKTFVYDPSQSFRGWLWRVCERKAIDYFRTHAADVVLPYEERDEKSLGKIVGVGRNRAGDGTHESAEDEEIDPELSALRRSVEQVHDRVKQSVKPETWEAFWLVGIMFWSLKDTARHLNMKIAAVSAAKNRVERRLREEGNELIESNAAKPQSADRGTEPPPTRDPGAL